MEYPLEAGGSVLIQVEDGHDGDAEVTRGWGDRDRRVVEQARESFEQAVARVQPAVQGLVRQLRSLADSPDAISVEFGLELSAEVGAFVAGASTKGNFKVSMTWQPGRPSEDA
ncbi:CU044_2847 family protein [Geodermatophilus sp. CPCC 205761]|uniref:CU044_2847 family protein n=1 Tax=Geodermatophilus sp. CPCC 205761 TaxID=2936597 RepID=UPI003EEE8C55